MRTDQVVDKEEKDADKIPKYLNQHLLETAYSSIYQGSVDSFVGFHKGTENLRCSMELQSDEWPSPIDTDVHSKDLMILVESTGSLGAFSCRGRLDIHGSTKFGECSKQHDCSTDAEKYQHSCVDDNDD